METFEWLQKNAEYADRCQRLMDKLTPEELEECKEKGRTTVFSFMDYVYWKVLDKEDDEQKKSMEAAKKEHGRKPFKKHNLQRVGPDQKKEMSAETLDQASMILALCNVLLPKMDELEKKNAFFRHELKRSGKVFIKELEKMISELYKNFDHDANLFHSKQMIVLEELLTAFIENKVEVKDDK